MTTLKKMAMVCLIALLALAIVAPLLGMEAATSAVDSSGHHSRILFNEIPTPTPTSGAGTDSNPSGGGSGGG